MAHDHPQETLDYITLNREHKHAQCCETKAKNLFVAKSYLVLVQPEQKRKFTNVRVGKLTRNGFIRIQGQKGLGVLRSVKQMLYDHCRKL